MDLGWLYWHGLSASDAAQPACDSIILAANQHPIIHRYHYLLGTDWLPVFVQACNLATLRLTSPTQGWSTQPLQPCSQSLVSSEHTSITQCS